MTATQLEPTTTTPPATPPPADDGPERIFRFQVAGGKIEGTVFYRAIGSTVTAAAQPEIEKALAAHLAEAEALPSQLEFDRLTKVESEMLGKVAALEAEADQLRETIAGAAAEGQLSKSDRAKLAALNDDQQAHADILATVQKRLVEVRVKRIADRRALATKFKIAAQEAWQGHETAARQTVTDLEPLWKCLDGLVTAAAVFRHLREHFERRER